MVLSLRRHRAVTGWGRVVRSGVEARSPTFAKAPADAKERALRRSPSRLSLDTDRNVPRG